MNKNDYPTKNERRKENLVTRNRRLTRDMKSTSGIMYHFQTQMPKNRRRRLLQVNGR